MPRIVTHDELAKSGIVSAAVMLLQVHCEVSDATGMHIVEREGGRAARHTRDLEHVGADVCDRAAQREGVWPIE